MILQVVMVRWWASAVIPVLLLTACAAAGCSTVGRSDPLLGSVVEAAIAPAVLPVTAYRSGDLLLQESGRCGGQRVSFGGRPEDGAAITLEVVRFRDAATAARAAAQLTPARLRRHVGDRAASLPELVEPTAGTPPEVVTALRYDGRVPAAERAASGVGVVPALLTAARADRVVALVESIGLPDDRQAEIIRHVADAALALPDQNCWGQEPVGAEGATEVTYLAWGTLLLLVLSSIVLLPIAALASWDAGVRRRSVTAGLLWLGIILLSSLWLVVRQ
jgi:hypothetical protein